MTRRSSAHTTVLPLVAAILLTFVCAQPTQAAVNLFTAQQSCTAAHGGAYYWLCKSQTTEISTSNVSPTPDSFVQASNFVTKITYSSTCDSSQSISAVVHRGDEPPVNILIDHDHLIASLGTYNTPYNGATISVTIVASSPATMVRPGCSIDLLSNVTVPLIQPLEWYLSKLRAAAGAATQLRKGLSEAAELPAKWSYLQQVPAVLNSQVATLANDITLLQGEMDDLAARESKGEALTRDEANRLSMLGGSNGAIALEKAQIITLSAVASQVASALSITSSCDGSGSAQCLTALNAVSTIIDQELADTKDHLADLGNFIHAEIARISASDSGAVAALKAFETRVMQAD